MSGYEEFDWRQMRQEEDDYFAAKREPVGMDVLMQEVLARMKHDRENCEQIIAEAAVFEKMPYRQYLRTDYWLKRSKAIKERDGFQCRDCGSRKRLNVHHKTYAALRGRESDGDLITLCRGCHIARHREKIPGFKRQSSR